MLTVPVTMPALALLRQAIGMAQGGSPSSLAYVINGKLARGSFGSIRFHSEGEFKVPADLAH